MRRSHALIIIAGLPVFLAACSARGPATTPSRPLSAEPTASAVSTAAASPEFGDLGDLRRSLENAGLDVGAYAQDDTKLDKAAVPLFPGAPLHPWVLKVERTGLTVFPYAVSDEASDVIARIDRSDPFPGIEFKGRPHLFLHDRAIVLFVEGGNPEGAGTDGLILSVLRSEFGTDYAAAP